MNKESPVAGTMEAELDYVKNCLEEEKRKNHMLQNLVLQQRIEINRLSRLLNIPLSSMVGVPQVELLSSNALPPRSSPGAIRSTKQVEPQPQFKRYVSRRSASPVTSSRQTTGAAPFFNFNALPPRSSPSALGSMKQVKPPLQFSRYESVLPVTSSHKRIGGPLSRSTSRPVWAKFQPSVAVPVISTDSAFSGTSGSPFTKTPSGPSQLYEDNIAENTRQYTHSAVSSISELIPATEVESSLEDSGSGPSESFRAYLFGPDQPPCAMPVRSAHSAISSDSIESPFLKPLAHPRKTAIAPDAMPVTSAHSATSSTSLESPFLKPLDRPGKIAIDTETGWEETHQTVRSDANMTSELPPTSEPEDLLDESGSGPSESFRAILFSPDQPRSCPIPVASAHESSLDGSMGSPFRERLDD